MKQKAPIGFGGTASTAEREPPEHRKPGIKRRLVLPAALAIQICLGGVYAWSAFTPALRADFELTAGQTQCLFGLAIAIFTVAMVLGGRWIERCGARRLALWSGVFFFTGQWLAAASNGHFPTLLLGSGGLVGISIGFGYAAALTTATAWFPRRKGLVIGVTVAAFGSGAMVLSTVATHLLQSGVSVLDLFRIIGSVYGAVIGLAGLLLFPAPATGVKVGDTPTRPGFWRDAQSRSLFWGMFCGTFAGLLVIGNLAPMGLEGGLELRTAAAAITFFAVGNMVGRMIWGWLFDRFGPQTIPVSLAFLSVSLMVLYVVRHHAAGFLGAALLAGFGFGSNFVLYAAHVTAGHGASGLARRYPRVFLAYGAAGLTGPPLGGYIHDVTGRYGLAVGIALMVLLIGMWKTRAIQPAHGPADSTARGNDG